MGRLRSGLAAATLVLLAVAVLQMTFVPTQVRGQSTTATVTVGGSPTGLAYDPSRGEVFVANSANDSVSVISDTNDSVVSTVQVGQDPLGLVYDPSTSQVFVANHLGNSISVISDSKDAVVATVDGLPGPMASPTISPKGKSSFRTETPPRSPSYRIPMTRSSRRSA